MERDFRACWSHYPTKRLTWPNRLEVEIDGLAAIVIGRDELLKNKQATGRPKDVSDARMLEQQKARKKS